MPSAARYIHNGSHPALKEWARASQPNEKLSGYEYNGKSTDDGETKDRGGGDDESSVIKVQANDALYGVQMACCSITDDSPDTLKKVGGMNPWQIQSMKILTGSEEKAHAPLTEILKDCFDLELDHHINVSGVSSAGHALDTQGFIAHNDTTIVLSYRCTTSAADWMTNLTTTTSAWEIEEDVAQGHSGWWSCWAGYCGGGADGPAPRVHTGFYNNFLVTVPMIRQYIDPLLQEEGKQRTLYVCGHSLGAGIAALAGCYFLLEPGYPWTTDKNQLRIVTAGGPRACGTSMVKAASAALQNHGSAAQFLRCVRDKDGVSNVPPAVLGFGHLGELVFLSKEDAATGQAHVLINPNRSLVVPKHVLAELAAKHEDLDANKDDDDDDDDDDDNDNADETNKRSSFVLPKALPQEELSPEYEKKIGMIPRSLRDHMPEFYLRPLYRVVEAEKSIS